MSEYYPGLEGVPATKSMISYLDGKQGILTYRGYPIVDLAENSTFEETAYLLIDGELPGAEQLDEFDNQLRLHRIPAAAVVDQGSGEAVEQWSTEAVGSEK